MSTLEVVGAGLAHATTGLGAGYLIDSVFPPLEQADGQVHKSNAVVAGEVLLQFTLGFWAMSEVMKMLLPRSDYNSPIGDGTSTYFFFKAQSNMWRKIQYLYSQASSSERPALLPLKNAPAGTIGSSPSQS